MTQQFSRINGAMPYGTDVVALTQDAAAAEAFYNHVLQIAYADDVVPFPTAIFMAQADDTDDEVVDDADLDEDFDELDTDELEDEDLEKDA